MAGNSSLFFQTPTVSQDFMFIHFKVQIFIEGLKYLKKYPILFSLYKLLPRYATSKVLV